MATYHKLTGLGRGNGGLQGIANALVSTSDKITSVTGESNITISIWDKFTLTFTGKTQTDVADFSLDADGTTTTSTMKIYYTNIVVEVIDGDDFLSVKVGPSSSSMMNSIVYLAEFKQNSSYYIANTIWTAGTSSTADFNSRTINSLSFYKDGGATPLTVGTLFSYTAQPGTLDYSDTSVFLSGGNRVDATNIFKACSNVTYLSTTAIGDKSYLAIGTNNIIEIVPITL